MITGKPLSPRLVPVGQWTLSSHQQWRIPPYRTDLTRKLALSHFNSGNHANVIYIFPAIRSIRPSETPWTMPALCSQLLLWMQSSTSLIHHTNFTITRMRPFTSCVCLSFNFIILCDVLLIWVTKRHTRVVPWYACGAAAYREDIGGGGSYRYDTGCREGA